MVVLVAGTGSEHGIRYATARRLATDGHTVYATVRDTARAADVAGGAGPGRIELRTLDLLDRGAMAPLLDEIVAAEGRLDTIVHNAGYGVIGASSRWRSTWPARASTRTSGARWRSCSRVARLRRGGAARPDAGRGARGAARRPQLGAASRGTLTSPRRTRRRWRRYAAPPAGSASQYETSR